MADTTRAQQVDEELNLHHRAIEDLKLLVERNKDAMDKRFDELMALTAGLAEEVRKLAAHMEGPLLSNPGNFTSPSSCNLENDIPETVFTRKEGNTRLPKLELPTFDGNGEWTDEFTEAVDVAYQLFDEMPGPILEEDLLGIEGTNTAHDMLDERPKLSPVDSDEDLYGNKNPLSSFPYILEISTDDDKSNWVSGLLTNLSMFSTQDLSSEHDVLGVSLTNFQSLSKLEFNPQVFDPGNGAPCSKGFFTSENEVRIEFGKWHSEGNKLKLLSYSNVYGEFMVCNHLVVEICCRLFDPGGAMRKNEYKLLPLVKIEANNINEFSVLPFVSMKDFPGYATGAMSDEISKPNLTQITAPKGCLFQHGDQVRFEWETMSRFDRVFGVWISREKILWRCSAPLWNGDNSINNNEIGTSTHVVWSNRPLDGFHVGPFAQICTIFDQAAPGLTNGHVMVVGNFDVYVTAAGMPIQRVPFEVAGRAMPALACAEHLLYTLLGRNDLGYQKVVVQRATHKNIQHDPKLTEVCLIGEVSSVRRDMEDCGLTILHNLTVAKLKIFVWDPGQNVISFYILEDKDVFERVGKDVVLMDTTLEITEMIMILGCSYGQSFWDPDWDAFYASRFISDGLGDTVGALDDIGLIPKTLIFSTAKLEHYIWDPGSFVSVSQFSLEDLDGDFHLTTLRTRWLLRGRICHEMLLLNSFLSFPAAFICAWKR